MKALVGAFNQEKALVGAFSVIVQPVVESMENYTALIITGHNPASAGGCELCCLTAEDGVDTEEAEDQALEVSEAGECRDTGPGQDTQGSGYTLYHRRSAGQVGDWLR